MAWTEIPSADTRPTPSMSSESWRHGLCNGRFDFRHQRVKSSFSSGGIPAFARRLDAVLALLAHLFFFIIRSRLLRIRDSCVEPIMILVAASKKLIKFDTKTFLSTINGGRKIADFPRKRTTTRWTLRADLAAVEPHARSKLIIRTVQFGSAEPFLPELCCIYRAGEQSWRSAINWPRGEENL